MRADGNDVKTHLTEGLFYKSRMKRPDICEAMKSMNFVLAPSTSGIHSA